MSREVKTFAVEEYHRGEWQPLMSKDKDGKKSPKTVKISIEHAELLSADAYANLSEKKRTSLFRYIEAKPKNDSGMKRPEMIAFCKKNGIEFAMKDKNNELKKKIDEFKSKKQ